MPRQFRHDGVALQFPDDWELEPEDHEDGWGLSLHSPGTAFVTLRCYRSGPPIEELAELALAAMRAEYPNLDAESVAETLAGQLALGHDLEFISLDATNLCLTRALYTDQGTLLFLGQTSDVDPGHYEPVLRGILASLRLEEVPEEESDESTEDA